MRRSPIRNPQNIINSEVNNLTPEFFIAEERIRNIYDDITELRKKVNTLELLIQQNKMILDGFKKFTWIVMGASASVFFSLIANKVF